MSMQVQRPATALYGNGQAITEVRQELARRMAAWIEAADELRRRNPEGPVVIEDYALRVELAAIAGELISRTVRARQGEASPRQLTASAFDALLDSIDRQHLRFFFGYSAQRALLPMRVPLLMEAVRLLADAVADEAQGRITEEAAYVLALAAGIVLSLPWRDARSALLAVAAKNDAKTLVTHAANQGGEVLPHEQS